MEHYRRPTHVEELPVEAQQAAIEALARALGVESLAASHDSAMDYGLLREILTRYSERQEILSQCIRGQTTPAEAEAKIAPMRESIIAEYNEEIRRRSSSR